MSDWYKIVYADPESGERQEFEGEFDDIEWARDAGYSLADKGRYALWVRRTADSGAEYWLKL